MEDRNTNLSDNIVVVRRNYQDILLEYRIMYEANVEIASPFLPKPPFAQEHFRIQRIIDPYPIWHTLFEDNENFEHLRLLAKGIQRYEHYSKKEIYHDLPIELVMSMRVEAWTNFREVYLK